MEVVGADLKRIVSFVVIVTLKNYIAYLCDSFLIDKAMCYDIKGKNI